MCRRALPPPLTNMKRNLRTLNLVKILLVVVGAVLAGTCVLLVLDASLVQARLKREFENEIAAQQKPSSANAEADGPARLDIPRAGISAMVMEGADEATLRVAVGHIPGTALPGQAGNVGLAGHRDSFFRGLRKVGFGDEITLTTRGGVLHYRVESIRIVSPDDLGVLRGTAYPALTLVTCYPFSYVGPAPQRWIVRARLTSA
jgi:sortase A